VVALDAVVGRHSRHPDWRSLLRTAGGVSTQRFVIDSPSHTHNSVIHFTLAADVWDWVPTLRHGLGRPGLDTRAPPIHSLSFSLLGYSVWGWLPTLHWPMGSSSGLCLSLYCTRTPHTISKPTHRLHSHSRTTHWHTRPLRTYSVSHSSLTVGFSAKRELRFTKSYGSYGWRATGHGAVALQEWRQRLTITHRGPASMLRLTRHEAAMVHVCCRWLLRLSCWNTSLVLESAVFCLSPLVLESAVFHLRPLSLSSVIALVVSSFICMVT
jgi:hypothetical protein